MSERKRKPTSRKRSVRTRFTILLLFVSLVPAAAGAAYVWLEKRRHDEAGAARRAKALGNAVAAVAESADGIDRLRRLVAALGAERDVASIVVATVRPLEAGDGGRTTPNRGPSDSMPTVTRPIGSEASKVLAATDRGLWDVEVDDIDDRDVVDMLRKAVSHTRFLTVEKRIGERLYVAAPLAVPDLENLAGRPFQAAVCVVADLRATRAGGFDDTSIIAAVFVVVAATVFGSSLLFESLIVSRLRSIVRHFQSPLPTTPLLIDAEDDEIGELVRSYGTALADSETVRRTLEETNARLVATMEAVERSNVDLVRARLAAEAANRTRGDFLANVSHELRTPLTSIIGYSDLIIVGSGSKEETADHARIIRRNGEHLLAMINDVLDLSALEAGRLRMRPTAFHPAEAARRVADRLRPGARAKGLELYVHDELRGTTITTDRDRLEQALGYLVDNAVKFTQVGRIDISVESAVVDHHRVVRFLVSDTGIGMSPDVMAAAFRTFTQADSTSSRRFGGTGIGLAVARRLAAALGARISVASEVGRGSTFTFDVPESPSAAPDRA